MTPKQIGADWYVVCGDSKPAGPFKTNSEAWRWIDRQAGEPISRAEDVSDWIAGKIIGDTA